MEILILFFGFSIGRLGDKFGGHLNTPHHWIYGLILFLFGVEYYNEIYGHFMTYFGLGCFISDLKDFLNLRIWGKDKPKKWRFWNID